MSSFFSANSGGNFGGFICVQTGSSLLQSYRYALFAGNIAERGGVVYVFKGQSEIRATTSIFLNNTALSSGGGYYHGDADTVLVITLSNSRFEGNSAAQFGGAFFSYSSLLLNVTNDSDIAHNSAGISGGIVYATTYARVYVEASNITHNSVGSSGAVFTLNY